MATNSPIDSLSDRQSAPQTANSNSQPINGATIEATIQETKEELILCNHCLRTATNGIKCQGICVADSGY